jgi:hypothetical protein
MVRPFFYVRKANRPSATFPRSPLNRKLLALSPSPFVQNRLRASYSRTLRRRSGRIYGSRCTWSAQMVEPLPATGTQPLFPVRASTSSG